MKIMREGPRKGLQKGAYSWDCYGWGCLLCICVHAFACVCVCICACLCKCVYLCVCACVCVCACTRAHRCSCLCRCVCGGYRVTSGYLHQLGLHQVSHVSGDLHFSDGTWSMRSRICLCPTPPWVRGMCCHTPSFYMGSGSELRSPCLSSKHFTHWAILLAPYRDFIKKRVNS